MDTRDITDGRREERAMNAASDDVTGSAIRPIASGMDDDPVPDPPTLSSSVPGMSAPLSACTYSPGQGQFPMGEPIAMAPAMAGGVQPLVTAVSQRPRKRATPIFSLPCSSLHSWW